MWFFLLYGISLIRENRNRGKRVFEDEVLSVHLFLHVHI